jgi:hypothetical protein
MNPLAFDILKMCAVFQSAWVRKLIGKSRVPYNRGVQFRGSSHPYFERDYEPFIPPYAPASKPFRIHFRIHSDSPRRDGMEAYARGSRSAPDRNQKRIGHKRTQRSQRKNNVSSSLWSLCVPSRQKFC